MKVKSKNQQKVARRSFLNKMVSSNASIALTANEKINASDVKGSVMKTVEK